MLLLNIKYHIQSIYCRDFFVMLKLNFFKGLGEEDQMLVDGDSYQTVTLVPSDTGNGEVSYVLVVQEEHKPVVNIDIKVDQVILL